MRCLPRVVLVAIVLTWGQRLSAQCSDGTPPPCRAPVARTSTLPSPNSVAVLYFGNLTRDSAYTYLADGLTEDLIALLGSVARLEVRSRFESARIREEHGLSPADIGRQLHVAYFVSGSVQPGVGRIRVNTELIEARSGRRMWGERLTVSGTDPLAVQESITTAVVEAVIGALLPKERGALHRRATRDSAAYDLYLRGRFFVSRLTEADVRQGLELYRQALVHDSTFALAWAGIAQAWYWLSDAWVPPREAFSHVRPAAERALALDSNTSLAYLALSGTAQQIDRDFARAETLARRAIALDPRLADAHAALSWILVNLGRPGEALTESERAWVLDSLSVVVRQVRMGTLESLGRASEVLALAQRLHWTSWEIEALLLLRRCAEAKDMLGQLSREDLSYYWSQLQAATCLREEYEARVALDSLGAIARNGYMAPIMFATAHSALGEVDEAFQWLERSDQNRDFNVLFINAPLWRLASVQADPRFLPLVRHLGIPWPAPLPPN